MERMKNLKKDKIKTKPVLLAAGALVVAAAVLLIPNVWGSGEGEAEQDYIEKGQNLAAHGVSIEKRKIALKQEPGVETVLPEDVKDSEDSEEAEDVRQIRHIQEPAGLRESLEQYFADFYQTLYDSSRNFTPEDFASTDGYIAWKVLENVRRVGSELYGGIADVKLKELSIDDIFEAADGTEVMVYLDSSISYHELPEEWEERQELYRVSVMRMEDSYQVQDLDLMGSEADLVKDILGCGNTSNVESNYDAIDNYFEEGHMY